jgi:hypothetical protein
LTWYNKDGKEATEGEKEDKRREEIRAIKEAEEDALAVALYVRSLSVSQTPKLI